MNDLPPEEANLKLLEIIRLGDFNNNLKVLDEKKGEFKAVKNYHPSPSKYGRCPFCFGFFVKKKT
jgi:hypothetical protein